MRVKLSDLVMRFVGSKVANSVFFMSGGGIMHLVDSLGKSDLYTYCCHHEQAAAIAAEGYARMNNAPGVVMVTTGPGGTNAVTGIAGAWLDSIPMFVIAGQVKCADITPRHSDGTLTVRQTGFQELNVIDIVRPVTKYAVTVDDPANIQYELEKALYLATHGRPGPVFVEIPLDVQAAEVETDGLRSFFDSNNRPEFELEEHVSTPCLRVAMIEQVANLLQNAKRPLLMAGNGIRLAGGEQMLDMFLKQTGINVVTPMFTADDLVTHAYPYYLGPQGMSGSGAANYAIDNCDVLLIIGERMQLTQTSYDHGNFATQATRIMVDIDRGELDKPFLSIDVSIHCDAEMFLRALCAHQVTLNRWEVPYEPINLAMHTCAFGYLNVYRFFERLNVYKAPMPIATANGMASVATHQAKMLRPGQRLLTNAGLGHMGSGLPLAIGACVANGWNPVMCMEGDGSIMLNMQELQMIEHHKLPIKIFIFNNGGYYSIRNTHQNYFGKVFAADVPSGVSFPDFSRIACAFGLPFVRICNDDELDVGLNRVMQYCGPIICELILDPNQPLLGRWTAGAFRAV